MAHKDIVFINGLVKSREKYLIGEERFLRMADAPSAEEAFRLLRETDFGGEGFSEAAPADFEKLCVAEQTVFFEFLKEYSPDDRFFALFAARNDFFNAEFAVRQKNLRLSDDSYMPEGVYSVNDLKGAAEGKVNVPSHLSLPMREAQALFDSGKASGAAVSTVFLRAYYAYMLKNVKNADWKAFIEYEIDAKNISVAFRASSVEQAQSLFLSGGKVSEKILALILSDEQQKALDKTVKLPCFDLIKTGFAEKRSGGALINLERMANGYAMSMLKEKRFETDGLIPMLLYANYKTNEIKNVRLVMSMKLYGADAELIKRRLLVGYER